MSRLLFFFSPEEWSREQQGCVQHLLEGVEGVLTLLSQFSRGQMSVGRERDSELQSSIAQSQTTTKHFQVRAMVLVITVEISNDSF